MMIERACRAAAIAIAVAAVVDPSWVAARTARARVMLTSGVGASGADADRVRQTLEHTFDVQSEESPDTAARVLVGRAPATTWPQGLTFVITPPIEETRPEVRSVTIARDVPLGTVSAATVHLALAQSTADRDLTVSLLADGMPADTRTVSVPAGVVEASTALTFVPTHPGLARLRVTARIGSGPEARADVVTDVTDRTLRVLVFEARPSWAATFLRRALEEDPRFEVVLRTITSRNVSVDAGAPPAAIDRVDALVGFDAVVVAAPELLGGREAEALDTYLREREGVVVALPSDQGGRVLARLTGVDDWTIERRPELERVTSGAQAWTASEFLWPSRWPIGAGAVTSCLVSDRRCAVWRVPVGGGRLVVSSALDGWRTRGDEASAFGQFWRSLIGDEAAATPRPIEITLAPRLVEPAATLVAAIEVQSSATVPTAEWHSTDGAVAAVRLWPSGDRRYRAEFRTPRVPGRYRLVVTSGSSATSEFLVADPGDFDPPVPGTTNLLTAFASARGGSVVSMDALATLPAKLSAAISTAPVHVPTHPMRSPFWIVPFAGLLAVEWWCRRRRGVR